MNKSFIDNKFCVLRSVLSKDYCDLFYEYFKNKEQSYRTMLQYKFTSQFHDEWGTIFDQQVPGAYSCYGDIMMDMLLVNLKSTMEKETGLKLVTNYAYARNYKRGNELKRHKDRLSCEISTTLNLGGDLWPIYVKPDSQSFSNDGVEVILNPGDMLIYRGIELEHWRHIFQGNDCCQVFLHYNDINNKNGIIYDGRPHLGLPAWFKTGTND